MLPKFSPSGSIVTRPIQESEKTTFFPSGDQAGSSSAELAASTRDYLDGYVSAGSIVGTLCKPWISAALRRTI